MDTRRAVDVILKASLPKLREKLLEALQAVLPIAAIVLVLCFTIAPVSPSILLCFLLGAAMIVVGIMFFIRCLRPVSCSRRHCSSD